MKKVIMASLVMLLVMTSSFCEPNASGVSLTSASEWAKGMLNESIDSGVVTPEVLDRFNENITRENFTELIIALDDKLYNRGQGVEVLPTPFTDVDNVSITRAYDMGIINGVGNCEFAPADVLNREQMAVIYAKYYAIAMEKTYEDISPNQFKDYPEMSTWARGSIGICYENGILDGIGDAMFDPQGTVTREIGIIGVNKLYKKLKTEVVGETKKPGAPEVKEESNNDNSPSGYKLKISNTENVEADYSASEVSSRYYVIDHDNMLTAINLMVESYGGVDGDQQTFVIEYENSSLMKQEMSLDTQMNEPCVLTLSNYGTYTVSATIKNENGSQTLGSIKIYYHPNTSEFSLGIKTYNNSNIDNAFTDKCGTDSKISVEVEFDRLENPIETHYLHKSPGDNFESNSYDTYEIPLGGTVGVENIKSITIAKGVGDAWRPEKFSLINETQDLIASTESLAWMENKYISIYEKNQQVPTLKQDIIGIQIYTSTKTKAGTDDSVYAKVYFANGTARISPLDKKGDDFEKGDTETYLVNLGEERTIADIERVTIYSGREEPNDWIPEYAKVITDFGEVLSYKNIDEVIDTSEYEIYNVNKANETKEKTTEVTVYVEVADKKSAGTDDGIYLDFFYLGEHTIYSVKLDTDGYNDFERNTSKTYKIYMKSGKGFEDARYIHLRNSGTDGVLVARIIIRDNKGNTLVDKYLDEFVDDSTVAIYSY